MADFMLGVTVVAAQGIVFGLIAYWFASRSSRVARIAGSLFVLFVGWLSVVQVINRVMGYQVRSDLDTDIVTILGLALGWIAGRNKRRAALSKSLFMRGSLDLAGTVISGVTTIYGMIVGFLVLFIDLGIVHDAAGFLGAVIGLCVAPVTFMVAPIYAGIHFHNWGPALLGYGGMLTLTLGMMFGNLVGGRSATE